MSMHELRAEARIPVTQRGKLSAGGEWFPCMVLDVSNSGFLLVSNKRLTVGDIFDFRCELNPGKVLDCKIEIMHSDDDSAGTLITDIDAKAIDLFQGFLQEKYAIKLANRKV